MDLLSDDVLLLIFEKMSSRELLAGPVRVCRRWAMLVERRALHIKRCTDLCRLHPGLHSLQISLHLESLQELLVTTAQLVPRLTTLTVCASTPFSDKDIATLSSMRNLEHLDIFTYTRVMDRRLSEVAARLSTLVVNESVAPGFFARLAMHCRLVALHMYGRALYYPHRELLAVLRTRQMYLRELTLRCTELGDTVYEVIGQCDNLTSLRLYSCWLMTGAGALHVVRPPRLRCLHLTGTHMVRRTALANLIRHLPLSLEEFVLSASCFGDEHVPLLVARVPDLRILELWRSRLSPLGVTDLCKSLPILRTLDLDLELHECHVQALSYHPTLELLRRLPPRMFIMNKDQQCIRVSKTRLPKNRKILRVESADKRYASKYFRGDGEGFRANLFYYSTLEQDLVSLPHDSQPYYDNDCTYY